MILFRVFSFDEPYCKDRLPAFNKRRKPRDKASPHANTSDLAVLSLALYIGDGNSSAHCSEARPKPPAEEEVFSRMLPPPLSLRGCTDLERRKSCLLQSPIDFLNSILNSSQTLLQCTHILRFHPITCWLSNNTLLC